MWSQHYATAEETTTAVHCYAAGRVGNAMVMILGTVLQTHDTRIIGKRENQRSKQKNQKTEKTKSKEKKKRRKKRLSCLPAGDVM